MDGRTDGRPDGYMHTYIHTYIHAYIHTSTANRCEMANYLFMQHTVSGWLRG